MEAGWKLVTPYNGHEIEAVEHDGRLVIVKRMRREHRGWRRELWARRLLDTQGAQLAPSVYWCRKDPRYVEIAMEPVSREVATLSQAQDTTIRRLGRDLARMHAACARPRHTPHAARWFGAALGAMNSWAEAALSRPAPVSLVHGLESAARAAPMTLVHRDLTDGNVLVDAQDHGGAGNGRRCRIIDWEVATVGHPDLDLARLRLALDEPQAAELDDAYRSGWPNDAAVPWSESRLQAPNRALFLLLFCAEMRLHLSAAGAEHTAYADEISKLAWQAFEKLEP